jgi:hypothetical protein
MLRMLGRYEQDGTEVSMRQRQFFTHFQRRATPR